MKPVKITFYVYAEQDSDIEELEKELHTFVMSQYKSGAVVTASKIKELLQMVKDSPLLKTFFK